MKIKSTRLLATSASILFISLFFQNCSQPVAFETQSDASAEAAGAAQANTDAPAETDIEVTPALTYPKLTLEAQPCNSGSICEVIISAASPVSEEISGSWQTNDGAWELQPDFYARPNHHFVSASGSFKIKAGEQSTLLRVTTISWENQTNQLMTLNIPVSVFKCRFGQNDAPCSLFFK